MSTSPRRSGSRAAARVSPTRDLELSLLGTYDVVIGMDEVGRGSLAGPLAVGAAAVDHSTGGFPCGLADSKLLSERRREDLVSSIQGWVQASTVGWASPSEICQLGLSAALRLAGLRALALMSAGGRTLGSVCILLDGNQNWLADPEPDLFSTEHYAGASWDVVTQVKADRDAAVVSAASVIAKVKRDRYMGAIADPGYDWAGNKGYSSASHVAALSRLGPSSRHRVGWRLPGLSSNSPVTVSEVRS